jgi:hypothetical protein
MIKFYKMRANQLSAEIEEEVGVVCEESGSMQDPRDGGPVLCFDCGG